jgi:hypothetical protein
MNREGARRFIRDVRALGALAEAMAPKRPRGGWVEVGPGVFKRNPAEPGPMPSELAGIVNGVRTLNRVLDQADGMGRAFSELERGARARSPRHR